MIGLRLANHILNGKKKYIFVIRGYIIDVLAKAGINKQTKLIIGKCE